MLIASVDLFNIFDSAHALCAHSGNEHGDARADVGADHAATAQAYLVVVAHNHGAVGVAKDYLRAHLDEVIYEEEAALKHLLMEEHGALCLCSHHDEHAQEVGR